MTNVTDSQKKLLILLVAVLLLAMTLKLVVFPLNEKTDAVEEENIQLQTEIDTLNSLALQQESFIQQTGELNKESDEIIAKYGPGNTPEKIIMFIVELSKKANMTIPSISFGEESNVTVLSDGTNLDAASVDPAAQDTADQSADGSGAAAEGDAAAEQASPGKLTDYYLYNYPVTFAYSASYSGLKDAIDYITNYGERMTIDNISISFDSGSGRLSGSMTLNMYTMTGTPKAYIAPRIDGIGIGVANPFRSVQ